MWYVEFLLLHRETIKAGCDIESDEYSDLLSVDIILNRLIKNNLLSKDELSVLDQIINLEDFEVTDIPQFNKTKDTFTKSFVSVCDKISIILGGIFTDAGYLDYLQTKYNLTEEQVRKAEKYILSNFRHKILSSPYNEKETQC